MRFRELLRRRGEKDEEANNVNESMRHLKSSFIYYHKIAEEICIFIYLNALINPLFFVSLNILLAEIISVKIRIRRKYFNKLHHST